jgi:hypothetical protein
MTFRVTGEVSREKRLARNEAFFREVNERIEEVKGPKEGPTEFLCECGRETCTEAIKLSTSQYEQLRSDPTTFAVVPGHEIEDIEVVVSANAHFNVVRKHESVSDVARKTDPRSR